MYNWVGVQLVVGVQQRVGIKPGVVSNLCVGGFTVL